MKLRRRKETHGIDSKNGGGLFLRVVVDDGLGLMDSVSMRMRIEDASLICLHRCHQDISSSSSKKRGVAPNKLPGDPSAKNSDENRKNVGNTN